MQAPNSGDQARISSSPHLTPLAPLPGASPSPSAQSIAVIADDQAIMVLVDTLIRRSGLSQSEIARRLGIRLQSLTQYRSRKRPSLKWIARLAAVVGAKITVELPR